MPDLTDYLRASQMALLFTGAGISTGSGIPDFRGPQGVCTRRQPVYFQDFMTASFPLLAAQRGMPYIIINRGATDHDHDPSVSLRIEGDVAEIFPAAVEAALT